MPEEPSDFLWVPGVRGAWFLTLPLASIAGCSLIFESVWLDSGHPIGGATIPFFWPLAIFTVLLGIVSLISMVASNWLPFNRRIGIGGPGVVLDYGRGGILVPWENLRLVAPSVLRWEDPARPSRWPPDGSRRFPLTADQGERLRNRPELIRPWSVTPPT